MTVPQLLEHRIDTLFEQLPLVGRLGQAFQEAGHIPLMRKPDAMASGAATNTVTK